MHLHRAALALAASLATWSSTARAVPAQNVVVIPSAWWQAEGNARDFFSQSNGSLVGSVSFAPGQFGQAFSFDGAGVVEVPGSTSLSPTRLTVLAYVLAKGASGCTAASYALYTGLTGGLFFYVWDGVNSVNLSPDAGTGIWDGKYHFVAGTYDGANVRLFVDGVEVGNGTPAPGPIDYAVADASLHIGAYHGPGCEYGFAGQVDEVLLVDRALTAAEVHGLLDSDGDGLPDDWERFGLGDANGNMLLDLPALGANPLHKDVFVEIDYMDCAVAGGDCVAAHSHLPKTRAISIVTGAFNRAPVSNPDGTTGISLHVDVSNAERHSQSLRAETATANVCDFEHLYLPLKDDPANFGTNNPRRFAYHYVLFAHQRKAYLTTNGFDTTSGCAEKPGNDFYVTLGGWNTVCIVPGAANTPLNTNRTNLANDDVFIGSVVLTGPDRVCDTTAAPGDIQVVPVGSSPPADIDGDGLEDRDVGTVLQQAGTLMHELGHNLSLAHGGVGDVNNKPNYLSIMNYSFQMTGIARFNPNPNVRVRINRRLDYSSASLPALGEGLFKNPPLDERAGIGDGYDFTTWFCPANTYGFLPARTALGNGAIDWNCNGVIENPVIADINGDGLHTTLIGHDDWDGLRLDFQNFPASANGIGFSAGLPPPAPGATDGPPEVDFPTSAQLPQTVAIDIVPGDPTNSVNPAQAGVIPVAILSDDTFDATTVSPLSVRFGPNGAQEVHGRGHIQDVDGDGRLDMLLHFAASATGIACGQAQATLTGVTTSGQPIFGLDMITTVGCKR
ncbi:MAG TPA: LamG domain-containing protein [Propionicimonas sp.]|jgi:hypothetical protein